MVAGVFIVVALSEELEERKAALPARKGIRAVAGLAVHIVSSVAAGAFWATATNLAEPLRPQTLSSKTCLRRTERKGVGEGVERQDVGWRSRESRS